MDYVPGIQLELKNIEGCWVHWSTPVVLVTSEAEAGGLLEARLGKIAKLCPKKVGGTDLWMVWGSILPQFPSFHGSLSHYEI